MDEGLMKVMTGHINGMEFNTGNIDDMQARALTKQWKWMAYKS